MLLSTFEIDEYANYILDRSTLVNFEFRCVIGFLFNPDENYVTLIASTASWKLFK